MKTVIPYMDKMNRIASLNLSQKVPVSLIILQLIDLLSGKRNLQKSSKNRVAKSGELISKMKIERKEVLLFGFRIQFLNYFFCSRI